MATHSVSVADSASAVTVARTLAPAIREASAAGEDIRHLPDAAVQILKDNRLFDIFLPKTLGGYECDMVDGIAVIEIVAAADPAAGWCLLKVASSNQLAGYLEPETARRVFGEPGTVVAGSLNPKGKAYRTEGGWRLQGRWDWGTATGFSDYILAGAVLHEGDGDAPIMGERGPVSRVFLVPKAAMTFVDTWHTYGMRGTGSGDFVADDIVIGDDMAIDMMALQPREKGALYNRVPYMAQVMLPHGALAVGIADAALEALIALAKDKTPLMSKSLLKDKYWVQDHVGRATADIGASRAWLRQVTQEAWGDTPFTPAKGLALSLASTHATHRAIAVVDAAVQAAGGSAVFRSSPLQRYFRDMHVAASHFLVNVEKYAGAGRVVFGDAASPLMG